MVGERREEGEEWEGGRYEPPPMDPPPPPNPDKKDPHKDPQEDVDKVAAGAAAAWARQATQHVYLDPERNVDLRGQLQSKHGGMENNKVMCMLYNSVISYTHSLYDTTLERQIEKRFICDLCTE